MNSLFLGAREFTRGIGKYLDKISEDKISIVVTRSKSEDVVVLPISEYEGMLETLHLLQNPANAAHLRRGMAEVEATLQGADIGETVSDFDALWK